MFFKADGEKKMVARCSTTAARNLVEHNTAARVRLLSVFTSTII